MIIDGNKKVGEAKAYCCEKSMQYEKLKEENSKLKEENEKLKAIKHVVGKKEFLYHFSTDEQKRIVEYDNLERKYNKLKEENEKLRECINYLEGFVEFCDWCKNPADDCICEGD